MPQISLKAARVNANLTQAEVAKRLHKNKQTITNWESGKTKVSAADLLVLCNMYKISRLQNLNASDIYILLKGY